MKWIKFNPKGVKMPKERRYVLVQLSEIPNKGMPPTVAVGYLRRHSGRNNFFVVPGVLSMSQRKVTHYCDCLGNDFYAPLWSGTRKKNNQNSANDEI